MKNEDKIVEHLSEMLIRQDSMVVEIKNVKREVTGVKQEVSGVKQEVIGLKQEVSGVKQEVSGLKGEMVKMNLQSAENTRAIFKLAQSVDQIADLHNRVTKLERTVYK